MALKAYRHLTDGEVKIVQQGSVEESALLADVVRGASYLQSISTGHAEEVPAAQGTALWVDVTSDLGGGGGGGLPTGMDYQLFEETNLVVPSGTDWSEGSSHVLGTIPFDFFFASINAFPELVFYKLSLETSAVLNGTDELHLGIVRDTADAVNTFFDDAGVTSARRYQTQRSALADADRTYSSSVPDPGENSVVLYTDNGPTTADITVVRARATFLVL